EGWMIDNFIIHETWFHTIVENSKLDRFEAYPTATNGPLHIQYNSGETVMLINAELIDLSGRVVEVFQQQSLNFDLDVGEHRDGQYRLKLSTNEGFDICPVLIQH